MIEAFKTALEIVTAPPSEVDPQDFTEELNADSYQEDRAFGEDLRA
tara:strand:+ start:1305 stop:1442 length:138 start_codon:yes stop_codon:yes gene_type:complete